VGSAQKKKGKNGGTVVDRAIAIESAGKGAIRGKIAKDHPPVEKSKFVARDVSKEEEV